MELIKELIDFFNEMKQNQIERNGYIFYPSINGFDVFTIPEQRLREYLTLEGLHKNSINSSSSEARTLPTNEDKEKKCHNTSIECEMFLNFSWEACEKCDNYY